LIPNQGDLGPVQAPTFCESEVSQVQEMDAGLGKRLKRF